MRPERWGRVERIFEEIRHRPPDEWERALAEECGTDARLRDLVLRMLREDARHPGFLETPIGDILARVRTPEVAGSATTGEAVGPYRLVRPLGHGGMGEVHLAERRLGDASQSVALKILRPGLQEGDLRERFVTERRILASMRHPNIAALFDMGTTEDGRPYLVMQYVDGAPLVQDCDRRRLGIRERVRLMATVCATVQHAHQSLVVHRDLKPANILVDERGEPMLLDFGIAKILDPEEPGRETTRFEDRAYTPEYAAPEQVRGEPVTTACDVYALGVVLFEVLAGRHPFDAHRASRRALERAVEAGKTAPLAPRLDDPDLPGHASARGTSPTGLRRALRGDLEAIVARAMHVEPARRYPSAGSLADDLARYLSGDPVGARPPAWSYRAGKFVRRHRVAVGAAASILVVLATAATLLAFQAGRLRARTAALAQERDEAMEVRSFLLEMFGTTGPDRTGDAVTARQLLDARAATLASEFGAEPATMAEMSLVLAEGYERLGLFAEAERHARRGVRLRRSPGVGDEEDLAGALDILGWVRHQRGQDAEAERLLQEAVELWESRGEDREGAARALNDLGVVLEARGDVEGATARYQASLSMRDRLGQGGSTGAAVTASNLAVIHYRKQEWDAAIGLAERARDVLRRTLGEEHRRTLVAEANLAAMKAAAGDLEGAIALNREILARRVRRLGEDHPDVAASHSLLGVQLRQIGALEEAERHLRQAIETFEGLSDVPTPDLALARVNLGSVLADEGRGEGAIRELREAVRTYRALPGPPRPELGSALTNLGWVLEGSGDRAGAERRYREAVDALAASLGEGHWRTGRALQRLGELLLDGDPASAVPWLERAASVLGATSPPDPVRVLRLQEDLTRARRALGRKVAADSLQAVGDSVRGGERKIR